MNYHDAQIGLMRCGQLLAESSPSDLLEKYQTNSLEEAFLSLSESQVQNSPDGITQSPAPPAEFTNVATLDSIYESFPRKVMHAILYLFNIRERSTRIVAHTSNFNALCRKNFFEENLSPFPF